MSYETNDKMVSHPDHYKSGKYEVIDIIDEFTKDLSGTEAVCTANAIKYILRWKKKNGKQDINKAIWYLMHLVDHLNAQELEQHTKFDEALYQEQYDEKGRLTYMGIKEHNKVCSTCTYYGINNQLCRDCHNKSEWEPKTDGILRKEV